VLAQIPEENRVNARKNKMKLIILINLAQVGECVCIQVVVLEKAKDLNHIKTI